MKYLLWSLAGLAFLGGLMVLVSRVWFSEPQYECLHGDCENGTGTKLYSDGTRYTGQSRDGRNHGVGLFENPDGHRYEGEWADGKKGGSGRYTYPGGTQYEGEFRENVKHGYGAFTWGDGTRYTGDWQDGEPHGKGKVALSDGTVLEGVYRTGIVESGAGIFIYDDGSRYIGQWEDGQREGVGVLLDDHGGLIWAGRWAGDERMEPAQFMDSQNENSDGKPGESNDETKTESLSQIYLVESKYRFEYSYGI